MIEAGQIAQRTRQPPSPSSSPLTASQSPSSNTSSQTPAVEKSESFYVIELLILHRAVFFSRRDCPHPLLLSLSSGGLVENSSDDRRFDLLQFPGGSWDGVPGFQKG